MYSFKNKIFKSVKIVENSSYFKMKIKFENIYPYYPMKINQCFSIIFPLKSMAFSIHLHSM